MKGYKGFAPGMICRGKQYAENTVFEEDKAVICESGMHFCDLPHAVFEYYAPGENNEFAVVESLDDPVTDDNTKYSCTRLKIGAKISVFDMAKASVGAFFEKHDFAGRIAAVEKTKGAANAGNYGAANAGDYGAANAGNYGAANAGHKGAANAGHKGAANAGDYGAANAGDCGAANAGHKGAANAGRYGAANAGDYGAANAGDYGAANAGDCGAANAGNYGAANAGHKGAANAGHKGAANAGRYGAANAGDYGAANAGDYGAAIVRSEGRASVDRNGVAVALGNHGKVKGGLGAILVLTEMNDCGNIVNHFVARVDGERIKADTWYKLENGEFVEV